jgi:hypothetical protein
VARRRPFDIWASVKDESLSDPSSLCAPEVIAAQLVEDATAGIETFAAVPAGLNANSDNSEAVDSEQDAVEALLPDEPAA